jgi:hypothetical protein
MFNRAVACEGHMQTLPRWESQDLGPGCQLRERLRGTTLVASTNFPELFRGMIELFSKVKNMSLNSNNTLGLNN